MIARGTVLLLTCGQCDAHPAHFQFSGDTDMITDGLSACGDRSGTMLTLFGSDSPAPDPLGDCRTAIAGKAIDEILPESGESFASFRHRYRPATLEYLCPWCEGGKMTVSHDLAPEEFIRQGGQIHCLGDITLDQGLQDS